MEKIEVRKSIFNSPIEVALRLLFIFDKTTKPLDLQRLIYYNYLLVHSSDIPESPKSLHADLPRRSYELLVNRDIVKKSLTLLIMKDLIGVIYSKNGILYGKNENTESFVRYFESDYSKLLQERAAWLCDKFDRLNDKELATAIEANLGKWGSEFSMVYDEVTSDV